MAEQCHVIAIKEKRAVGARKKLGFGVHGRFWSKSRDVVRDVVEGVGWADVFIVDVEHPDLDVSKSGCTHPDLDVYGLKHPDAQKLTRI